MAAASSESTRLVTAQREARILKRLHHSHGNVWLKFHNTTTHITSMYKSHNELQKEADQLQRIDFELPQALHDFVWLVTTRYWDEADMICMS